MFSCRLVYNSVIDFRWFIKAYRTVFLISRQLWYHRSAILDRKFIGSNVSMSRLYCHLIGRKCPSVTVSEQQIHVLCRREAEGLLPLTRTASFSCYNLHFSNGRIWDIFCIFKSLYLCSRTLILLKLGGLCWNVLRNTRETRQQCFFIVGSVFLLIKS